MIPRELCWVDIETTGLDPETDKILEVAVIITDFDNLSRVYFEKKYRVYNTKEDLDLMSYFVRKMHTDNGLLDEIWKPSYKIEDLDLLLSSELIYYLGFEKPYLCGNSVHFDRSFMKIHMPRTESLFGHRHIDVSSIFEFCKMVGIKPDLPKNTNKHRAMDDIKTSIATLETFKKQITLINSPR